MKLIIDIKDTKAPFFMELIRSLDYISIIKEVKDKSKSELVTDLAEAFNNVKEHEKGNKKLKSAKDLLNEL